MTDDELMAEVNVELVKGGRGEGDYDEELRRRLRNKWLQRFSLNLLT